MRWLNSIVGALCFSLVALLTTPAAAQSELEGLSFEELIGQAKTAYTNEKFDEAIKYLLAANRAQPNARLLLNVAKSYEKSGDCVKALVYFRAFVRDPDAEPALVGQAKDSLAKAGACSGWNEMMSGRLLLSAFPVGASATVDGNSVGTLPTEVAGLMEGKHTIVVSLDGYVPFEETLNLFPDKDATVKATLEEAPVVVQEPDVVTPPVEEGPSKSQPIIHYAIGGGVAVVGLTLFTVGLITDLGIPGKYDDPRGELGITQAKFDELTESRKSAATTAIVMYVIGGVLIGGGAGYVGYVAATSMEKEAPPRLTLAPEVGPTRFGLSLSGSF